MPNLNNTEEYKACNSDWNVTLLYLGYPLLVFIIVLVISISLMSLGLLIKFPAWYMILSNIITIVLSIYLSCYFIDRRVNKIKKDCYNYGINKSIIVPVATPVGK